MNRDRRFAAGYRVHFGSTFLPGEFCAFRDLHSKSAESLPRCAQKTRKIPSRVELGVPENVHASWRRLRRTVICNLGGVLHGT